MRALLLLISSEGAILRVEPIFWTTLQDATKRPGRLARTVAGVRTEDVDGLSLALFSRMIFQWLQCVPLIYATIPNRVPYFECWASLSPAPRYSLKEQKNSTPSVTVFRNC